METSELPRQHDRTSSSYSSNTRNVYSLLARREISPRTKHVPKWHWGEPSKSKFCSSSYPKSEAARDAKRGLLSWVEADSLQHLSAKYCPLWPPPRSTIAAAFSPDGKVVASTHGDHTVKIIDSETGNCLKELDGHSRTPWVVRFHPFHQEVIASGSLDQEVRLWDTTTSEWIISHHFNRPIVSIAFHANAEIIAVASGRKLYMWWEYTNQSYSLVPVLKSRRSLRAVHFHPHGAPYLLTAQVNDLDSSDSSMTEATSLGYLQYPPPAVFVKNVHPRTHNNLSSELPYMSLPLYLFTSSYTVDESRIELQHVSHDVGSASMQAESSATIQFQDDTNATEHNTALSFSEIPADSQTGAEYNSHTTLPNQMRTGIRNLPMDDMVTYETEPAEGSQHGKSTNVYSLDAVLHGLSRRTKNGEDLSEFGQVNQFFPSRDPSEWELPFLQGWLMGRNQVGVPSMLPQIGGIHDSPQQMGPSTMASNLSTTNVEVALSSEMPGSISIPGASVRSGLRNHFSESSLPVSDSGNLAASINTPHDESDSQTIIIRRIQSLLATSAAAAAGKELPCTVNLKIWSHDIENLPDPLNRCRLTIPHAVLCSEMGTHFSPCGRLLAACVACMLPHIEADPGLQTPVHQESGVATLSTRHPISAHQVIYELRIYSIEEATFGSVLASRAIRAAHCLTSIRFSPTSEHILLAYGRRHGSLLKSIVIDGETTLPIYTVLEVYRVSDMELVRVLPSANDEVNVACFHPFAGEGLVYGTKEGKLRLFHFDRAHTVNGTGSIYFPEENIVGVSQ